MNFLEWKKRAFMSSGSSWFLPSGIGLDDCIAAYQWKGADSFQYSAHDLTEHGYDLTYDWVSWDASTGITCYPGSDLEKSLAKIEQTSLSNLTNIVTQVVSFSDFVYSSAFETEGRYAITNMKHNTNGIPKICLVMTYPYKEHASPNQHTVNAGHWGALFRSVHVVDPSGSGEYNEYQYLTTDEWMESSGIVAVDKNNRTLWKNGYQKSAHYETVRWWDGPSTFLDEEGTYPVDPYYFPPYRAGGVATIRAAVYFACSLTAEQHLELAQKIALLGS